MEENPQQQYNHQTGEELRKEEDKFAKLIFSLTNDSKLSLFN